MRSSRLSNRPLLAERLLAARAQSLFQDRADLRHRLCGIGKALARRFSAQGLRMQGFGLRGAAAFRP